MPAWESWSYAYGPAAAFLVVGLLALVLRWAFGPGTSLVQRRPRPGNPDEYGLLVPVADPGTAAAAQEMRQALEEAGIRATVAGTVDGPRLFVFAADEAAARRLLDARRREG